MAEPWAKRHSAKPLLDTIRKDLWVAHRSLPAELRPHVSAALRRVDREWMIVDDDLRDALPGVI
jgi:hypothetical protein